MNTLLKRGVDEGLITLDFEDIREAKQITYIHQNKKRNYRNPEEKVQAIAFLKLVLVYKYPVERVKQFVSVTMGASTKEADIVVYNDDDCTQPLIIVECKHNQVSELEFKQAIEQAAAYAYALAGTIKYLWVTSDLKNGHFLIDKDSTIKQTIPNIPRYGITEIEKYKYAKGGKLENEEAEEDEIKQRFFDLRVIDEADLTNRFKQAHNALWAGGELNPSEAFDELDKLIFCKIWDERKKRKKGEPYDFQIFSESIPKHATQEQIDKIETKISESLFARINALYAEGKKQDPEVFKDDIRLNHQKVKTVVAYLEEINLGDTDLDSKGKAFETFMSSYFRGNFGQFFTPRPIVKFIVSTLPITNEARVLDTSCGSGGFLLYALDKVRQEATEYYPDFETDTKEAREHWQHWHDFAEKNLFGIEINEQIARSAKMNMIIHDDGHTNVISSDGLLKSETIIENSKNDGFKNNSFDFIITNPPFGSVVKQTERAYLTTYELGNKDVSWLDTKNSAVQKRKNQSTEVLFIEQCHNFLNEGGFLAIVLPDGVLTNSSLQEVRDKIEKWYRIVAVVSMPQTAFAHTGAGVKSSVLFLRKWNETTTNSIETKNKELEERIRTDNNFFVKEANFQKEKKQTIKTHTGFENTTSKTGVKEIEKTKEFKDWKKEISDHYNQKISDLKEEMEDLRIAEKQKRLDDYPIFMAIAEDIGYDATGKATGNNELDEIGKHLTKFVNEIIKEENL